MSKKHFHPKVYVFPERKYIELGSVRYAAHWCTLRPGWKPGFELDTPDLDMDILRHGRHFATLDAAVAEARRILSAGEDCFGAPCVIKQVVDWFVEEDRIAEWADVGEPLEISETPPAVQASQALPAPGGEPC
jgi:hypothetical protein